MTRDTPRIATPAALDAAAGAAPEPALARPEEAASRIASALHAARAAWALNPGECVAATQTHLLGIAGLGLYALAAFGAPRRTETAGDDRSASSATARQAVADERAYQDRLGPDRCRAPGLTHVLSQGEILLLIGHYLAEVGDGADLQHRLRKITALAIQALEKYGLPEELGAPAPKEFT